MYVLVDDVRYNVMYFQRGARGAAVGDAQLRGGVTARSSGRPAGAGRHHCVGRVRDSLI